MMTGNGRLGQIRSSRDWQRRPWHKAQFEKHWHFCRTDFQHDEWLCRICDRYNPHTSGKPLLYLERDAIEHETTSEHQYFVNQHQKFVASCPELLRKQTECEMGWGPVGDLLSLDEVYETLRWNAPDVRKGADFVNQFVAFWVKDVAAAFAEVETKTPERNIQERGRENGRKTMVEREAQEHRSRPTFEEFFESIVIEPLTWDFPSDNVYDDGWGTPVVPVPNANLAETTKKRRNGTDSVNWVTQRNGKGNKRGRGRGKGRIGRQPNPDTARRDVQVASQNLFAQLQLVDEE